jgi:GNAT superfamily N-acetyltransferase
MSQTRVTIRIRLAHVSDANALAVLSAQLGYPADEDVMRARLACVRGERIGEVFVAVDSQDHVLGWTHVVSRVQLEEAPFAELAGLVVDESARSNGVGRALLEAAEGWAREQGIACLRVRSNVVRDRAHRFYLREGYSERKRQVVFIKTL